MAGAAGARLQAIAGRTVYLQGMQTAFQQMRKRFIRLTIEDRVKMEMSPYDTAKARIVYRL